MQRRAFERIHKLQCSDFQDVIDQQHQLQAINQAFDDENRLLAWFSAVLGTHFLTQICAFSDYASLKAAYRELVAEVIDTTNI
jgi:hypothetical protein